MVGRYCGGVLPAAVAPGPAETAVAGVAARATEQADDRVGALDFSAAIGAVWQLVDALNGYLTEQQPWQLAKSADQRDRLDTVLATAAEGLRVLAVLLNPVMPRACAALWASLGAEPVIGPLDAQPLADAGRWGQLPAGVSVIKGAVLFPRLDDDV
jgi:methionyl-tRNA synthetase